MTIDRSRVMSAAHRAKIMPAEAAAALVPNAANVGMSGFTGSGYPKAVPAELARRIEEAHDRGEPFRIGVWTGASTAPELDGRLVPSTSVGNNKTWLDQADRIILEVNSWMNPALQGMHDIYYGTRLPPHRTPIPILSPGDRIGETTFRCDPSKVIAVVETDAPDRNTTFAPPDQTSKAIAGHILEFLEHGVRRGRLPSDLLPIQSGVGNVANAVMAGLEDGPFTRLTAYTEVLQDGMLNLIRSGRMVFASATALSLSSDAAMLFNRELDTLKERIVLRTQEISIILR